MEESILQTESLNLHFGDKHVLKDIDVEIPEKKITSLIGPSGCGKSTLLRTFNRMHDLSPDAKIDGDVYMKDIDIYAKNIPVTETRMKIGMVFQKPNPLPKSIYENIAYPLRLHKYPKNDIPQMVEQALKDAYIWEEVKDDLQQPAISLSGGQQQRLCIARTIVLRPEIILMDEPCSALDPLSTQKIEELILRLRDNFTIVIVTHNMQQAQRISDKVVFMYLGKIVESGDTSQIFNQPQAELTQNYIRGQFG